MRTKHDESLFMTLRQTQQSKTWMAVVVRNYLSDMILPVGRNGRILSCES